MKRRIDGVEGLDFEAAIFDLDGVITRTARLHAQAWKSMFDEYLVERERQFGEPFRPFSDEDYRTHVDGRPRYDGVRAFLASRGLHLPDGMPTDLAERETVSGLGNRKNAIFRTLLEHGEVQIDRAAVSLIRDLRSRGVAVGVASSSKNTDLILERAGLPDLFDARVDGVLSEQLDLAGKPAPDIFLECLARLGVRDPERALVVEDAVSGVAAARAGGFGLALGVDRGGQAIALRVAGADWVVRDFAALTPERISEFFCNRDTAKPNAIAHWGEIESRLGGSRPVVFLDYDGTLTPIVARPDLAVLSDSMRTVLRRLSTAVPTTILSGRGREDLTEMVGLEDVTYAGSHGFDIAGPGADAFRHEIDPDLRPAIVEAGDELHRRTRSIEGVLVEDKKYSVAVHYRLADEGRVPEIERIVDEIVEDRPQLRKSTGKMVFEVRPGLAWDKGRAILWLLDQYDPGGFEPLPVFIGDDVTDEDAFTAIDRLGIGILVTEIPRETAAAYSLQDVEEVREFLARLADGPGGPA